MDAETDPRENMWWLTFIVNLIGLRVTMATNLQP